MFRNNKFDLERQEHLIMISKFKYLCVLTLFFAQLFFSSSVFAARCGGGKIIEIKEGGWNSDDLLLSIDYSDFSNQHPGTTHGGYIRFSAESLSSVRLEAIRKLAITALVSGKTVLTYSHNDSCSYATELTLYAAR